MSAEKTFEETYPHYPFAKLVTFTVSASRAIAKLGRDGTQPERFPDVFLDKIESETNR